MTAERPDFDIVSPDEYRRLRDDPTARIKMGELEQNMVVEVYGIGPAQQGGDFAIKFTSQVEIINLTTLPTLGHIGLRLTVISGELDKPAPGFRFQVITSPEPPHDDSAPLTWTSPRRPLIQFTEYGQIIHGYFANWADADIAKLDESV